VGKVEIIFPPFSDGPRRRIRTRARKGRQFKDRKSKQFVGSMCKLQANPDRADECAAAFPEIGGDNVFTRLIYEQARFAKYFRYMCQLFSLAFSLVIF
jgi:hypothetical protein